MKSVDTIPLANFIGKDKQNISSRQSLVNESFQGNETSRSEIVTLLYEQDAIDQLRCMNLNKPLPGKQMMIDDAVESGKTRMAAFLMEECNICPSLYAVQMGNINGNTATVNLALSRCHNKLRSDTDIKTVHYNYKQHTWSDAIPERFRIL